MICKKGRSRDYSTAETKERIKQGRGGEEWVGALSSLGRRGAVSHGCFALVRKKRHGREGQASVKENRALA